MEQILTAIIAVSAEKNILSGLANGAWIGLTRSFLGLGKNLSSTTTTEQAFDLKKMLPSLVIGIVIGGIAGASGLQYDKIESIGLQLGLTYAAQDALKIAINALFKK